MTPTEWRATLRLPGGRLECTIRRSTRARNLRLTVDPRYTAVVVVPSRAARSKGDAERLAETFVREREAWLRRHLADQARQNDRLASFGRLADGGLLLYRGEPHLLRVQGGMRPTNGEDDPASGLKRGSGASSSGGAGRSRTSISRVGAEAGDELVVKLGRGERRELAAILEAWLRVRARAEIERQIERHVVAMGVAPAAVTVRDARTRWGSCSRARRLSFSWRLVLAPPEALETVVVHELAHLRVFGHGPEFWAIVAAQRPDHGHWRRWLRDHRLELQHALADR